MWQNLQENAFLLIKMQSESLNFFTEHPRRDVECNFDADVTPCITYTQHNF